MTAPKNPSIHPRIFLLRVYSVKRVDGEQNPSESTVEPYPLSDEPNQVWEVRAETDVGAGRASLFYVDIDPRNLPPLDSLIHVTIDDQLTEK